MVNLGTMVKVDTSPIPGILGEMGKRNITLKAVRSGIKIVQKVARRAAPKRLGHLKRAQGIRAKKGKKTKTGAFALQGAKVKYEKTVAVVKVSKGKQGRGAGGRFQKKVVSETGKTKRIVPAFYDHLVIGGTKPHVIRKGSKLARTRRGKTTSAVGQASGKPHPGARANPYRKFAFESCRQEVDAEVARVMAVESQVAMDKFALKMTGHVK